MAPLTNIIVSCNLGCLDCPNFYTYGKENLIKERKELKRLELSLVFKIKIFFVLLDSDSLDLALVL